MSGRARTLALGVALLFLVVPRVAAHAEIQRLQVTGAAPARDGASGAPRAAALAAAIEEGVLRVASKLLDGDTARLVEAEGELKERLDEFAVRYRILEDRGERRALLIADPDVTHEYVVEAEVHVDAGRLRDAMVARGWLEPRELGPSATYELTIAAPVPYRVFAAFIETLAADREVRSATPSVLRRDEFRVHVDSTLSPRQLVAGVRGELAARGVEVASATPWNDSLRITLRDAPELQVD